MPIIALENIRHSGQEFKPGDFLELTKEQEARLVKLKSAEYAPVFQQSKVEEPVLYEYDTEDYEDLKKELDAAFNRDPLASEARAAGVQFDSNAKKEEIIHAVITQGKAEQLLGEE
ncbi:hypothetical protein CD798_08460 [Bacillaceae bacterium SAOS 7]|nr:hypothetical protein CD798_08460 [Bacillaceae bacterium SAOS 7]